MAWYAKPKGGYSRTSPEGITNIFNYRTEFSTWSLESVCGMLGNVQAESGLNPWRWQGDRYGTSRGYGLFQYTPASGYINLSGATPNLSVDTTTSGATPEDAIRQIQAFRTNELGKWNSSCWRSYWNDDHGNPLYADLWAYRSQVLARWGSSNSISIAEFSECGDMYDATFIFLACFEGPRVPNLSARNTNTAAIYQILTGDPPPTPPEPPIPPPPPEPPAGDFDLNKFLMYCKRKKIYKKVRLV